MLRLKRHLEATHGMQDLEAMRQVQRGLVSEQDVKATVFLDELKADFSSTQTNANFAAEMRVFLQRTGTAVALRGEACQQPAAGAQARRPTPSEVIFFFLLFFSFVSYFEMLKKASLFVLGRR